MRWRVGGRVAERSESSNPMIASGNHTDSNNDRPYWVRRGNGGWPMGSDPTAACGGRREGSDWQRSARDEGASAPRIFAGHRNRIIPTGAEGEWEREGQDPPRQVNGK